MADRPDSDVYVPLVAKVATNARVLRALTPRLARAIRFSVGTRQHDVREVRLLARRIARRYGLQATVERDADTIAVRLAHRAIPRRTRRHR